MTIKVQWNTEQFARLKQIVQKRMLTFSTMFCQELNNEMVIATPVVFGFLRGSWFNGLNEIPDGVGSKDPSGGDTSARLNEKVLTMTIGDIYYLVNTAVYAARVEYGFFGRDSLGRQYNQEGRGFVRSVVAKSYGIATDVANRVATGRYDA